MLIISNFLKNVKQHQYANILNHIKVAYGLFIRKQLFVQNVLD